MQLATRMQECNRKEERITQQNHDIFLLPIAQAGMCLAGVWQLECACFLHVKGFWFPLRTSMRMKGDAAMRDLRGGVTISAWWQVMSHQRVVISWFSGEEER